MTIDAGSCDWERERSRIQTCSYALKKIRRVRTLKRCHPCAPKSLASAVELPRSAPRSGNDEDRLGDQSKAREAIGNRLLDLDDAPATGNKAIVRALDKAPDRLDIDAGRGRLRLRDLFVLHVGPNALGGEHVVPAFEQRISLSPILTR